MASIRDAVAKQQRERAQPFSRQHHGLLVRDRHRSTPTNRWSDRDETENQAVELYEAMEADLERIDDISAFVRRHVNKGTTSVALRV